MPNKEVATEMYITIDTVEKHLSNIYKKLNIRSRAQLHARLSDKAPGSC